MGKPEEKQKDTMRSTNDKKDPYKEIKFVKRQAKIEDKDGNIIFDEEVEFPDTFSDAAVKIVSSKYLCNNAKVKENSIRQMIDRVANTISDWGKKDGYFVDDEYEDFKYKLKYYQINQYFTFNSPIYFNVGIVDKPQCSACFLLDVEDNMESIYDNIKLEAAIFKGGSGSGSNLSSLRSSKERVRGGGFASGAVSFLKAADTSAGIIRSGGTLRRSAKLVCIDDIYPDIQKFIHCKENEELKLHMLKESGFVNSDGYEMSDEVFFQNTNISVRLSDEFMEQVEKDGEWWTKYVLTGERCEKFKARNLLKEISEIAWKTADPGVQFSGNINRWNTCANSGEIKTSNPCSEFLAAPGNLSCNLASINLRKCFYKNNKGDIIFDTKRFKDIVRTIITAQDIIVDNSSYPSRKITKNSHMFRPLGLGYSNLGALLMWLGLSYDSDDGRNIAGLITALLTGIAYDTSNILADKQGSFEKFEENKKPFYKVLNQHYDNQKKLIDNTSTIISDKKNIINQLSKDVIKIWDDIKSKIDDNRGFRNSQATLLAPTGTTSFMMDCDTFGVEPDYSLIKYKTLSGNKGAIIKTVNNSVREALENLQYSEYDTGRIIEELCSEGHLENSNVLNKNHISIFDTASIPNNGKRCIDYMGHIKMLESVQPFLSGAISKTINLPSYVTVDDIYKLYLEAWRRGLKGVTVYRDGSKVYQPLRNEKDVKQNIRNECKKCEECEPFRSKLPEERDAFIHKFSIGAVEGYLTIGKYPTGKIGEIFLTVSKQGSTLSGLLDSLAIMVSTCLQYGVPLRDIVSKLMYSRFEPAGITRNEDIRFATSIVDYLARYLGNKFLSENDKLSLGLIKEIKEEKQESKIETNKASSDDSTPICDVCGELMQRVGSCFNCNNCGANSGACG